MPGPPMYMTVCRRSLSRALPVQLLGACQRHQSPEYLGHSTSSIAQNITTSSLIEAFHHNLHRGLAARTRSCRSTTTVIIHLRKDESFGLKHIAFTASKSLNETDPQPFSVPGASGDCWPTLRACGEQLFVVERFMPSTYYTIMSVLAHTCVRTAIAHS